MSVQCPAVGFTSRGALIQGEQDCGAAGNGGEAGGIPGLGGSRGDGGAYGGGAFGGEWGLGGALGGSITASTSTSHIEYP